MHEVMDYMQVITKNNGIQRMYGMYGGPEVP